VLAEQPASVPLHDSPLFVRHYHAENDQRLTLNVYPFDARRATADGYEQVLASQSVLGTITVSLLDLLYSQTFTGTLIDERGRVFNDLSDTPGAEHLPVEQRYLPTQLIILAREQRSRASTKRRILDMLRAPSNRLFSPDPLVCANITVAHVNKMLVDDESGSAPSGEQVVEYLQDFNASPLYTFSNLRELRRKLRTRHHNAVRLVVRRAAQGRGREVMLSVSARGLPDISAVRPVSPDGDSAGGSSVTGSYLGSSAASCATSADQAVHDELNPVCVAYEQGLGRDDWVAVSETERQIDERNPTFVRPLCITAYENDGDVEYKICVYTKPVGKATISYGEDEGVQDDDVESTRRRQNNAARAAVAAVRAGGVDSASAIPIPRLDGDRAKFSSEMADALIKIDDLHTDDNGGGGGGGVGVGGDDSRSASRLARRQRRSDRVQRQEKRGAMFCNV
jgi:hypothetical protein